MTAGLRGGVLAAGIAMLFGPLAALAAPAAAPDVEVEFLPPVEHSFEQVYGTAEEAVLRQAIVTAVTRELKGVPLPAGAVVRVQVRDVTSTRLTLKQQSDHPALDPWSSKNLGGADLAGSVEQGGGTVLASVTSQYYPVTLHEGSASRDPWGDAYRAFDLFAAKLAKACRQLSAARS